jgi:hypothetical protein
MRRVHHDREEANEKRDDNDAHGATADPKNDKRRDHDDRRHLKKQQVRVERAARHPAGSEEDGETEAGQRGGPETENRTVRGAPSGADEERTLFVHRSKNLVRHRKQPRGDPCDVTQRIPCSNAGGTGEDREQPTQQRRFHAAAPSVERRRRLTFTTSDW